MVVELLSCQEGQKAKKLGGFGILKSRWDDERVSREIASCLVLRVDLITSVLGSPVFSSIDSGLE